jgi:chromosomal replication initiator protein
MLSTNDYSKASQLDHNMVEFPNEPISDTTDAGENEMASGQEGTWSKGSFDRVMAQLKGRLGAEVFSSWFGRVKLVEASKSQVRLSVPTVFLKNWIVNHYHDVLVELLKAENDGLLRVDIIVRSPVRAVAKAPTGKSDGKGVDGSRTAVAGEKSAGFARAAPMPRVVSKTSANGVDGSPLDSRYRFDTFVEGPSNRVALAAARSVAEAGDGPVRFNPLFIHGSVGNGKTHLLQAIAAEATQRNPKARIVYLTAEYFMWRFATAFRDNHTLMLKEQLRDIDLLIIDDMQFLQGKSIQNEFCHLINMLLDGARQVVVAADRAPAELESLEPRVRSRMNGGVAIEIGRPEYEMRFDILRQKLDAARSEDSDVVIDDVVLQHVARTITGSGRELEGAFNQLLFRRSFEPQLSLERIDELLGHLNRGGEPKPVRIEDIQKIVARHYNVSRTELLSNRRTRTIVKPRQVAMYLAKTLTPRSLPEIGRRFGGRDHTTVLHAIRKIEQEFGTDQTLAQQIELLKRLVQEQAQ